MRAFCYTCSDFHMEKTEWQSFFSSWTQSSVEFLKILNVPNDHLCHKYVFWFENGFLQVKPSTILLLA